MFRASSSVRYPGAAARSCPELASGAAGERKRPELELGSETHLHATPTSALLVFVVAVAALGVASLPLQATGPAVARLLITLELLLLLLLLLLLQMLLMLLLLLRRRLLRLLPRDVVIPTLRGQREQ